MADLVINEDIALTLERAIGTFSNYLSGNIHVLNKFIGHLRRVGVLKYERTTIIKFVKKLRFFNDTLLQYKQSLFNEVKIGTSLTQSVIPVGSFFIKALEVMDLLNFFFTQSLQREIISKTLNFDLTLEESCILTIEDAYNHFVKYTQWMLESLGQTDILLRLEVITFALKCAEQDDGVEQEVNTDNIFLQEVIVVEDEQQYNELAGAWDSVLRDKISALESELLKASNDWHEKFGKRK
ncbi:She2p KNAG_0A06230 [Huiozyma naganishii CBS 8797]|uniref:RNA binding protein She2 domain-containing protein n=1 Tax=Huiozyma naganishii (strain ATCC MYA-139 / BCRC 22969 / CBS 8797 / KCTC 17520 / NBRC 10181 / NCYC 3082 / Yp74L-3) TaxID=1071383 RepID=J7S2P0_HUIN7|nr:hypothetical protein KNAG_0A06230 [Kazachstania naganishii CBS 8797]CCK68284.1 hypothetical protein KNAG_0A06230 [Kazachstania naganishii CBS 8797]